MITFEKANELFTYDREAGYCIGAGALTATYLKHWKPEHKGHRIQPDIGGWVSKERFTRCTAL